MTRRQRNISSDALEPGPIGRVFSLTTNDTNYQTQTLIAEFTTAHAYSVNESSKPEIS